MEALTGFIERLSHTSLAAAAILVVALLALWVALAALKIVGAAIKGNRGSKQ